MAEETLVLRSVKKKRKMPKRVGNIKKEGGSDRKTVEKRRRIEEGRLFNSARDPRQ